MKTLADITLDVARVCTDVLDGAVVSSTTTSLTDGDNLIQDNGYWDKGTLWITGGAFAGRVLKVKSYLASKLTFAALSGPLSAGNTYSVARVIYPWAQLVSSVNQALQEEEVFYIEEDVTLFGDGSTLEFTLPDGVSRITRVEIEDPDNPDIRPPSTHWFPERVGSLRFHEGYPPRDMAPIHLFYKADHPRLSVYNDEIMPDINYRWLIWKSSEKLLYWALKQYPEAGEYKIEELMNQVLEKQKGLYPVKPVIYVQTTGG